jgi:O-antigen/teichoic acid export membrane protein
VEPRAIDAPEAAASSAPAVPAAEGGIKRRAVRGFAWAVVSYGGNKLVVFGSTLVLTRLLAPAEFGVVAAGLAFMAYLEVLLDLGLNAAVVYRQEQGTRGPSPRRSRSTSRPACCWPR